MGFGCSYVSRANVRDSSKHVILGTQQYKPSEFATQITLNMDNAWGILRCIIDLCMKQKDGKYLIMKDPNKVRWHEDSLRICGRLHLCAELLIAFVRRFLQPLIRLYDIPDNTFDLNNDDDDDDEEEEEEIAGEEEGNLDTIAEEKPAEAAD